MIDAKRAKEISSTAKGDLQKLLQEIENNIEMIANTGVEHLAMDVPVHFEKTILAILNAEGYDARVIEGSNTSIEISWSGLPF